MTVDNRLYVGRNLTFSGQGHMDAISPPLPGGASQLSVGGYVRQENQNGYVGSSSAPIVNADLIGGCVAKNLAGYTGSGGRSSASTCSAGKSRRARLGPALDLSVL